MPFMGASVVDVGLVRAQVARLSVIGELGYEINCRALEHADVRRTLLEAGRDLGVREYGYNALLSLRLEKSFGIWSAEFTQAYTPRMTGMDRWIAWDKGEFVGREAALAETRRPAAVASARHAGNRRGRRGRFGLRAGLASWARWPASSPRAAMAIRFARAWRWRSSRRNAPRSGRSSRPHRRRRAQGARHRALAVRPPRQSDAGMTREARAAADR